MTVRKFTNTGGLVTEWQSGTSIGASGGIATDAAGNVYTTDPANHRVRKFAPDGALITQWGAQGQADNQFERPEDIAVDPSGNVFVEDSGFNRIKKFDSSGTFITKFGGLGQGPAQFGNIGGIAAGSGGVYVTDSPCSTCTVSTSTTRVQKLTSDGTFVTEWGSAGSGNGQFTTPRGIAVDAAGNVYVVDLGNSRVQVFDSAGAFLSTFGSSGGDDGEFTQPTEIATGSVYVGDSTKRIQKFDEVPDTAPETTIEQGAAEEDRQPEGDLQVHVGRPGRHVRMQARQQAVQELQVTGQIQEPRPRQAHVQGSGDGRWGAHRREPRHAQMEGEAMISNGC